MSFERSKQLWSRLSVKIASAYLVVFMFTIAAIFTGLYFLLVNSLERHDRNLIRESFGHYMLLYQSSGIEGLKTEIAKEDSAAQVNQLLLRIQDEQTGEILYNHSPKDINEYDVSSIDAKLRRSPSRENIVSIPSREDSEDVLEILQGRASDGKLVQVGKNSEDREDFLDQFRDVFLVVVFAAVFIGLVGGFFLVRRALRPLQKLISAIRQIDDGQLNAKVEDHGGNDELTQIGRLFNKNWSKNQRLVKVMRQSLDMIAHDIRTPMTRVRGFIAEGLQESDVEKRLSALTEALVSVDETMSLLTMLLDISEAESGAMKMHKQVIICHQLLDAVRDLYSIVAEDKSIDILIEADRELVVPADARLKQALANLLDNAIKYSPSGRKIIMSAKKNGDSVLFEVTDEGPGISEQHKEKIWQRFYRGEVASWQPGLGLGLSLVSSIVEAHGGSVEIADSQGAGTTFRIILPV